MIQGELPPDPRNVDGDRDETGGMRRWVLVDFDGTGLMQIQANDQHPDRDLFGDKEAVEDARKEAADGDAAAQAAIAAHERDEAEIIKPGPAETRIFWRKANRNAKRST